MLARIINIVVSVDNVISHDSLCCEREPNSTVRILHHYAHAIVVYVLIGQNQPKKQTWGGEDDK